MLQKLFLAIVTLSVFFSCKRVPEEFYELQKVELNYFDLIYQKLDSTYYPATYDETRNNEFCVLTVNFKFVYYDSTESGCPLSPGCAGPRDEILEISFPSELFELDSSEEHLIIINEHAHPLPYDPNEIHKKLEANNSNYKFTPHISEILKIKETYNNHELNNNELLTFDEFYYIKKTTLSSYVSINGIPTLEVITSLRRLN